MAVESLGFRFSLDKRFSRVNFSEFLSITEAVLSWRHAHGLHGGVEVLTAEDWKTYQYTTTTFWSDEIEEALKQRKRYFLADFNQEIWNRALDVQVAFRNNDPHHPNSFISVSCDKEDDSRRIKFYGQCLAEEVRDSFISRFRRRSLSYGVGDGMGKISTFNLYMGQKLTGLKLPM